MRRRMSASRLWSLFLKVLERDLPRKRARVVRRDLAVEHRLARPLERLRHVRASRHFEIVTSQRKLERLELFEACEPRRFVRLMHADEAPHLRRRGLVQPEALPLRAR